MSATPKIPKTERMIKLAILDNIFIPIIYDENADIQNDGHNSL